MLRGPLHASFPSLEQFPRQAGTSGHVYPFQARSSSPVMPQSDVRLPANMASATFWRSPYSEAIRQSRSTMPKALEVPIPRSPQPSPVREEDPQEKVVKEEKGSGEKVKSILKNGSEGKDSGSDTSSDNLRQIRGILCKSSLSTSSRQSAGKVQKRVKFDDNVDSDQNPRQGQHQNPHCNGPVSRQDHPHLHHRAMSASPSGRPFVPRMPSLRHDGDRLQSVDKNYLSLPRSSFRSLSPHRHHGHHHHHQQQHQHHHHMPRPHSGPLLRSSSMSDLSISRPAPRNESQHSCHLVHGGQSNHNAQSGVLSSSSSNNNSVSSRLSPTTLEFKIYRQPPVVTVGSSNPRVSEPYVAQSGSLRLSEPYVAQSSSLRVAEPSPAQSNAQGKSRCLSGRAENPRPIVRLSRSLTSSSITLTRPVKRPTPCSLSPHEDTPLMLSPRRVNADIPYRHLTTSQEFLQSASDVDDDDNDEESRENFLDEDKTVQILHWLQEVDHKQAREGRCSVFVHGGHREG